MIQLYVSEITQMIARAGISVRFAEGVPRTLNERLVPVALARGIKAVGMERSELTKAQDTEGDDRVPAVVEAIRALQESGEAKAFSERTGEPNLNPLRKQAGFQVTDAERDAAWALIIAEE